jgi:hypothetical protein
MAQDAGAGRVGRAQSRRWDVEPTQVVNSAVTGTVALWVALWLDVAGHVTNRQVLLISLLGALRPIEQRQADGARRHLQLIQPGQRSPRLASAWMGNGFPARLSPVLRFRHPWARGREAVAYQAACSMPSGDRCTSGVENA